MFELNLIKDKALQRQRRRIIFMAIVMVVFLSGLMSIFVGGMIWKEHNKIEKLTAENETTTIGLDGQLATLDIEQPKADKRRRGLILAYQESVDVRTKRPQFTNILKDIVSQRPPSEFWYNSLTIDPSDSGASSDNPHAAADALISRKLRLEATGYIQIVDSDVITKKELDSVAKGMQSIEYWMSEPNFTINEQQKNQPAVPGEVTLKYSSFTMTASRRSFSGGGRLE
ncbi:hypothetical protein OAU50_06970 [Planctomycetota bacterium]|nr:hypothetical protein [Planctomycetota bacterium]